MDVRPYTFEKELGVSEEVLAFDVEMANSFPGGRGVICMIGIEWYDQARARSEGCIGSVTAREDEPELITWFLDQLAEFHARHPNPKLLTFSGLENDLPWIRDRMERHNVADPARSVLANFDHIDLRQEFYRRTFNRQVSLKNLEKVFGIHREETISSKQVSFMLTGVLRNRAGKAIPDRIFEYLRDDVHNLFSIYDQWSEISLRNLQLSESEYLTTLQSLARLAQKLAQSEKLRADHRKDLPLISKFAQELGARIEESARRQSFRQFRLPSLPEARIRNSDFERLLRKYRNLQEIQVFDRKSGVYRLRRDLYRPKGALALVRNNGRVLMIRRADHLKRAAGFWGLPGGVVESGEAPTDAAVRELQEELNLTGRALHTLGTSASVSGEFELHWVEVEVEDVETLAARVEEVADARWVAPSDLVRLEPLIPGALEGFSRFLGGEWAGLLDPE
ncbi:MAG: NUDIX domain-containing protein [Candidatus Lambdaproteobacteria bacterium]|nr:NUDIX domain-containing protein [Candidatus Lambdaproteobacteria bacterium]